MKEKAPIIVLATILIVVGIFYYGSPKKESVNQNPIHEIINIDNNVGNTGDTTKPPKTIVPKDGNDSPVACTMDAKMCPDGSYVGRTGPNCEFAACPASGGKIEPNPGSPIQLGATYDYHGVKITPLKVVEDSRCSPGVQCFWAGRLVVLTRLEDTTSKQEVNLELGKSYVFNNKNITLYDEVDGKLLFTVK